MVVGFGARMEPTLVRRGAKRVSEMWEERADQINMEVCPDTSMSAATVTQLKH